MPRDPTRLGFLLSVAYRLHVNDLKSRLEPHDLSHQDFRYLYLLSRSEKLSASDITSRLELTKANATAVIQSLLKRRLISREQGDDARRIDIRLSARGREVADLALTLAEETIAGSLEGFSAGEIAQLEQLLCRMVENRRAKANRKSEPSQNATPEHQQRKPRQATSKR